jgi:glycerol-3-phosphate acyltransferase PlsX
MKSSGDETVIVVDAMGGDHAPEVNVKGAVQALSETERLKVILVGDQDVLRAELRKLSAAEIPGKLEIVHCDEVISMDDHAASVIRKKKNSSIHVGLQLVRERQAHAFISAGNSGAVMAGALVILGRLADVERPAIVVKVPTAEGFTILLDVGANVDCKPIHLYQFAEMGHVYAEVVEGISNPRIALLSNGSEVHKGNELTRETDPLLRARTDLNYLGYVEGYDLFRGTCDVVVCDGFVGNVTLKLAEGLADTVFRWFRREIQRDLAGIVGVMLLRKLLRKFKRKFDYQPYGAAPLLGIDGMVLISHGSSTEIAIRSGILTAKKAVEQGFIDKIRGRLETHAAKSSPNQKDDVKK